MENIPSIFHLQDLLQFWVRCAYMEEGLLSADFEPGASDTRLVIVTGDNATGKSFFCRFLQEICASSHPRVECIRISMQLGTKGGIASSLAFGDEALCSTGVLSVNTVLTGVHTSRKRTGAHVMIWDEPDVGVSTGYQAALGRYLAEYVRTLPDTALAVVVTTHAPRLLRPLVALHPHHIRMGGDGMSLQQAAFDEMPERSIQELQNLGQMGTALLLALRKYMKEG